MQPCNNETLQPVVPQFIGMMSLVELGTLLIKHNGIHEGLYNVSVEFQIGVGSVGPEPNSVVPGAMIGVSKIGLAKVDQSGPHTVDASKVNPVKKPRTRSRAEK